MNSQLKTDTTHLPIVVVQGLGFVGTAMIAALASAHDTEGNPRFQVVGIDLPTAGGKRKIEAISSGKSPILTEDTTIEAAIREGVQAGTLTATSDTEAYGRADVVVVDIHLDVHKKDVGVTSDYEFSYDAFLKALEIVARKVSQDTLILLETTVPPGTTDMVVKPLFERIFTERGLDPNRLLIGHSYERVMPGKNYLKSITDFYRVFAGVNKASGDSLESFLSAFINTKDFPLTRLHSTTASEMAKVLENSYRAMNIAFIQEWTEFAQLAGVNLVDVIQAIRVRPTHRNIMLPGFGVGGYCLTKDALLADYACVNMFGGDGLPQSLQAIRINDLMPNYTCGVLDSLVGNLTGQKVAILGVSYINDVADTRFTPTEILYKHCIAEGAEVMLHDTLLDHWEELDLSVHQTLEDLERFSPDVCVFCVGHSTYRSMTANQILSLMPNLIFVLDAFNVLSEDTAQELIGQGVHVAGIGKGHLRKL